MSSVFNLTSFRALSLLSLLGLGLVQVGCAHSVRVEPSVVVHSRIGHVPVFAQVGLPGPMIYAATPRVIYVPAPPPRVVHMPRVDGPFYSHDRRLRAYERRHSQHDEQGRTRGDWGHRHDGHR